MQIVGYASVSHQIYGYRWINKLYVEYSDLDAKNKKLITIQLNA
jgi:hypothetical protein